MKATTKVAAQPDVSRTRILSLNSREVFVAKGNDGNYLQHSVEIAAAVRLAGKDSAGRLHIAVAHRMAPFEACDEPRPGQPRRLRKGTF